MKVLVIFDGEFDFAGIPVNAESLDLLPMTGDWNLIESLKCWCGLHRVVPCLLESARLFDAQVFQLKSKLNNLSTSLGDTHVLGRTIKEWFLIPGVPISTWWFSCLAEKNNIKENAFFQMAQLVAIDQILGNGIYDRCHVAVKSLLLRNAFIKLGRRKKVKMVFQKVKKDGRTFGQRSRASLDSSWFLAHFLHATFELLVFLYRCWFIKEGMGSPMDRQKFPTGNIVVTYYPYLDRHALDKGSYQNTYALPLQKKINDLGQKINWICMIVPVNHWTFRESVKQASVLANSGEPIYFLFEFGSIRALTLSVVRWILQTIKMVFITPPLEENIWSKGFETPEVGPMVQSLWRKSFAGWVGLEGLLYFGMFEEVVRKFPEVIRCIYFSEMHAWEKALNGAKRSVGWSAETLGFQHAAISKNHYFYHVSPEEVLSRGLSTDMPLPNVMAANGKISFEYLSRSRFPGLVKLEAVRHLSLEKILQEPSIEKSDPPVLLVIGSYSLQESRSLFNFTVAAWKDSPPCRVWFKPHPSMGEKQVFHLFNVSWPANKWEVRFDDVGDLLRQSSIVVSGESSVTINALAYGCEVIAPVLNDVAFMSPLGGHESYYEKIYNPEDLRETVTRLLKRTDRENRCGRARSFVASYWDTDPSLPQWEKILQTRNANAPA